jgi:hypothetical protein
VTFLYAQKYHYVYKSHYFYKVSMQSTSYICKKLYIPTLFNKLFLTNSFEQTLSNKLFRTKSFEQTLSNKPDRAKRRQNGWEEKVMSTAAQNLIKHFSYRCRALRVRGWLLTTNFAPSCLVSYLVA